MQTLKLSSWSVRRSGAGLSVTGKDETGQTRKVTGIQQIYPAAGMIPHPHGAGKDESRQHVRIELAA